MKELMKKAHQMTREIVEKYNDVDYRVQFSLCLSCLIEEGRKEKMIELKGTPKQVAWAEKIRANALERLENGSLNGYVKETLNFNLKIKATEEITKSVVEKIVKMLKEETDSVFFIENLKNLDIETLLPRLLKEENILMVRVNEDLITSNLNSKDSKLVEIDLEADDETIIKETIKALKAGNKVKTDDWLIDEILDEIEATRKEQIERKLFK